MRTAQHDQKIVFSDTERKTRIAFSPGTAAGPEEVAIGSTPIVGGCFCRFGALTDAAPVIDSFHHWRKNIVHNVEIRGFIPFASQIAFRHIFHNAPGYLAAITDITVPRRTTLSGRIEIASVTLPGAWHAVTGIGCDANSILTATRREKITGAPGAVIATWAADTVALIFEKSCGRRIEIGIGSDIWRWHMGFCPEQDGVEIELTAQDDGLVLHRIVSRPDRDFVPAPRRYRFSWYMAWSDGHTPSPPDDRKAVGPVWSSDGDIDFESTQRRIKNAPPGTVLAIDFETLQWNAGIHRRHAGHGHDEKPCFAANRTLVRCRRIIRQIAALDAGPFPVQVGGLAPGICDHGRHILRHGKKLHWDLPAIMQLATWTRQCIGNSRELSMNTAALPCPSLMNLLTAPILHHDDD